MGDTHFQGRVIEGAASPDLAVADVAISGAWGNAATRAVTAGSKDRRGRISVTSNGTGQAANPTVTVTFKEPFDSAPFVAVGRADVLGTAGRSAITARSATAFTATFVGTPVAGETYILDYQVL